MKYLTMTILTLLATAIWVEQLMFPLLLLAFGALLAGGLHIVHQFYQDTKGNVMDDLFHTDHWFF